MMTRMSEQTFARRLYLGIIAATGVWCALILAAPLLAKTAPAFSDGCYRFFSQVCHQLDGRSFHLEGRKFAVCIRCSSIYFSFLATIVVMPLVVELVKVRTPSSALIGAMLLPMAIDVLLHVLGVHPSNTISRMATGMLAGIALARLLVPLLLEAALRLIIDLANRKIFYATKTG
jgi:uncharacterized membrane protein